MQTYEKRGDAFSSFHPLVNLLFFMGAIGVTMLYRHPLLLAISLLLALLYSLSLNGVEAAKRSLFMVLPLLCFALFLNPLFSRRGATVLGYVWGNPLTLESLIFGAVSGMMLLSVTLWFFSYSTVMTSDKLLYLFGRWVPVFSLIFSMVLRFVPRYQRETKRIMQAQQCIGRGVQDGHLTTRVKNALRVFSITVTWALEDGITTADSMRSRGYGLKGRTAYSLFRLQARDKLALFVLALLLAATIYGMHAMGGIQYFPEIVLGSPTPMAVCGYLAFGGFCLFPLAVNLAEEIKWKYSVSRI